MTQSLQLGGGPSGSGPTQNIRRLNRLPIIAAIVLSVLFLAVIFYGLMSRGLIFGSKPDTNVAGGAPATTFADQMKREVADGIIGDGQQAQPLSAPVSKSKPTPQILSSRSRRRLNRRATRSNPRKRGGRVSPGKGRSNC